jgi:hypothetical protein
MYDIISAELYAISINNKLGGFKNEACTDFE